MFEAEAQLIDAAMARALHLDACRDHPLVAWVNWHDNPAYPGRYIAQLAAESPLPYVLIGDTLAEVQAYSATIWMRQRRQTG